MLDDIVKGFLERQQQVMPYRRGDRPRRESQGNVQPHAQAGALKVFAGITAQIVHEAFERVVLGVECPHNLVNGHGHFARQRPDCR